eukprot:273573-Pyramimonas_sp.AAC.1
MINNDNKQLTMLVSPPQALAASLVSTSTSASVSASTSASLYTHWSPRFPGRAYVWATDQHPGEPARSAGESTPSVGESAPSAGESAPSAG